MRIARNAVYGLVASLVLVTLSFAIQKAFSRQAPTASDEVQQPTTRTASAVVSRVARSSDGEDDGSSDPGAADSDVPAAKRGPINRENARAEGDQVMAAGSRPSARDQVASDQPDPTWSNPLSRLASLFTSGGGGSAGAPATVASNAANTAPPQSNPVQAREVFFGESEETACQSVAQDFALENVRDLHVCVVLSGLSGTYWAQLTFLSPDGNAYQKMTQAFVTVDAPETVATVEVEGRQYPVRRAGWRGQREAVLVASLPVAGTYISQHNLAGIWTMNISLNGRPVDWGQFTLHPRQ